MTTNALVYRFIKLFLFLSTIVFIITSCKLSESGDGDDNNSGDGTTLIGTQVIGPAGGEINLDSIVVKVPANTFNEDNEISIYIADGNDGFNEYANSALYQIAGLPSTINKPIELSIKYHGSIEGDTLVAIGEMKYSVSLDSSLFSYHAENAIDSVGYLVYDLPAYSGLGKLTQSEENNPSNINIVILGNSKKIESSRKHFLITCPMEYVQNGIKMGEYFEAAFSMCNSWFDLTEREWADYPAKVLVKSLGKDYGAYFENIEKGFTDDDIIGRIEHGSFQINPSILNDDLKLKTTCGHEFLHLVQNLYEFNSEQTPEQPWLQEATSTWIEERYANSTDYVSEVQIGGREFYPFDGWQYSGRKYGVHGYGLAVIIKGIVELYGDNSIVAIFNAIKAGELPSNPTDPVDAVLSVITHPVEVFWHNLLSWYTLGNAYNSQVNFKFLDKVSNYKGTVAIDTLFTTKSFKLGYHDLSGKLFKVQFGDISTLTTLPLSISVDDEENCGILVCKFKQGEEISSIGEVFPGEDGIVTLDDVKPIFDDGYEIVVLVTNSSHDKNSNYQNSHEVELTIERPVVISKIDYRVQCEGSYEKQTNLPQGIAITSNYTERVVISDRGMTQEIDVSGNTITVIADSTAPNGHTYQIFLVLELDDIKNPTMIISFMVSYVSDYQSESFDQRVERNASGQNVPLSFAGNPVQYMVEGDVDAYISDFNYTYTEDWKQINPNLYDYRTMLSYDGTTDGRIYFNFYYSEE